MLNSTPSGDVPAAGAAATSERPGPAGRKLVTWLGVSVVWTWIVPWVSTSRIEAEDGGEHELARTVTDRGHLAQQPHRGLRG